MLELSTGQEKNKQRGNNFSCILRFLHVFGTTLISKMSSNVVRVGIGCLVIDPKTKKFLIGKRKGSHESGTYQLPGGHLEVGETWSQCAARELKEETGIDCVKWELTYITNDVMQADKHYITLFMRGEVGNMECVEPKLMEPDKCEGWYWVDFDSGWDEMKPMFSPLQKLHEAYQTYKWNPFGSTNIIDMCTE